MPLELRDFEEADLAPSLSVGHRAHRSNGGLTPLLMTTEDVPAGKLEHVSQARLKAMREQRGRVFFLKVVDTDANDRLVAYAIYSLDVNGRTEEELDKACAVPSPPPDVKSVEGWNDLFGYLGRERRRYLGLAPALYIPTCHTDPEYHRKGCGSMLMKRMVDHADQLGLRCYLEATSAGKGLYDKFGFQVLHEERFELTKYGLEGVQIDYVMERPPAKKPDSIS